MPHNHYDGKCFSSFIMVYVADILLQVVLIGYQWVVYVEETSSSSSTGKMELHMPTAVCIGMLWEIKQLVKSRSWPSLSSSSFLLTCIASRAFPLATCMSFIALQDCFMDCGGSGIWSKPTTAFLWWLDGWICNEMDSEVKDSRASFNQAFKLDDQQMSNGRC